MSLRDVQSRQTVESVGVSVSLKGMDGRDATRRENALKDHPSSSLVIPDSHSTGVIHKLKNPM